MGKQWTVIIRDTAVDRYNNVEVIFFESLDAIDSLEFNVTVHARDLSSSKQVLSASKNRNIPLLLLVI